MITHPFASSQKRKGKIWAYALKTHIAQQKKMHYNTFIVSVLGAML